ncbi:MAG TPA: cohesin domain-containing protein, partial [Candidatus Saccharimonadales bacterium]|nr:cohesin domain-containing protein [Candidatus Saccharimonadales bacterium]
MNAWTRWSSGRHLRSLFAIAALLSAAAPGAATAGTTGPGQRTSTVRAVVRPATIREGQVFTVEVRGSDLDDATALSAHLVYDPALVEPLPSGFTEGPLLRRGGAATSFLARPATTGDRVILGIARLGREPGARGQGLFCTLAFRALKAGSGTLVFDRARLTGP